MYKGGLSSKPPSTTYSSIIFVEQNSENSSLHMFKDCILITDWNRMIYKTDG